MGGIQVCCMASAMSMVVYIQGILWEGCRSNRNFANGAYFLPHAYAGMSNTAGSSLQTPARVASSSGCLYWA